MPYIGLKHSTLTWLFTGKFSQFWTRSQKVLSGSSYQMSPGPNHRARVIPASATAQAAVKWSVDQQESKTTHPCRASRALLVKGEVRDGGGVAARVIAIGVVREERVLRGAAVHGVGRGVDALHLVEHHALEGQVILWRHEHNSISWPALAMELCFWHRGDSIHNAIDALHCGWADSEGGVVWCPSS